MTSPTPHITAAAFTAIVTRQPAMDPFSQSQALANDTYTNSVPPGLHLTNSFFNTQKSISKKQAEAQDNMIPKGPKAPQSTASHQNKVWMNPMLAQRRAHQREKQALNNARKSVCKNSDIWHKDFDLHAHKEALAEAERKKATFRSDTAHREWEQKREYESKIGESLPPPGPIRPAFDGKSFLNSPHPLTTNRSGVLALETIFTPDYDESVGRELADWPSMEEMMFEGTGRVSTERIHARFLPLPRQPGNPTVNFTLRDIVEPFALDNFTFYPRYYPQCLLEPYPKEEDVLPKHYRVEEWEFTDPVTGAYDDDAVHALGTELLALLDCRDQY